MRSAVYGPDPAIFPYIGKLGTERAPGRHLARAAARKAGSGPEGGDRRGHRRRPAPTPPIAMGDKLGGKGTIALTQGAPTTPRTPWPTRSARRSRRSIRTSRCSTRRWKASSPPPPRPRPSASCRAIPDVTGAFSTTGNGIQTWSGAARKAGRDVVIIGMDYIRQNLDIVKSGGAYGIVAQPLYEEGAKTAELAAALAEGKTVDLPEPDPGQGDHRRGPRSLLQDPGHRRPVTSRSPGAASGGPGLLPRGSDRVRDHRQQLIGRGIVKSFAGVQALRGVDFRVPPGEIHALLGQNGAGKSTLVKILNGVHPAGSLSRARSGSTARRSSFASPADARAARRRLCAAGNRGARAAFGRRERLCRPDRSGHAASWSTSGAARARRASCSPTSASTSIPRALVASLTSAQRHLVMIARALSTRPRVLMLDEPTASLSGAEVERLFGVLRRLKAQGITMIYITHRLPEVLAICDRATVLRDGRVAAEIAREDFDEERFIFAMSGPAAAAPLSRACGARRRAGGCWRCAICRSPASSAPTAAPATSASRARRRDRRARGAARLRPHRDPPRHLRPRAVPAARSWSTGQPVDDPLARATPGAAGIALLTEDRKRDGLLFNLPVGANITIGNLEPLVAQRHDQRRAGAQRGPRRHAGAQRQGVARRRPSVAHLSGGNQQKLLFARVLMRGAQGAAARRADQGRRRRHAARDLPADRRPGRQRAWRCSSSRPNWRR